MYQRIDRSRKMVKLKNRYALIEVMPGPSGSTSSLTPGHIFVAVLEQVAKIHGDFGAGAVRSSLHVKVVDGDISVLRLPADSGHLLLSSLPFIRHINMEPVTVRLLFCGRSIRSCEKRLLQQRRKELSDAIASAETPGARQSLVDSIKRMESSTN